MAQYDDVRTSTIALIGFISALVLFVLTLLLLVLYQGAQDRQNVVKEGNLPLVERDNLLAKQESQLHNYRWLKEVGQGGKKRQVYAIPIDRAMELVVAELSAPGGAPGKSPPRQPAAAETKPAGDEKGG